MKKIWLVAALAALTARLCATSYYVSQSSGSDANAGTSTAAPWKTLAKVNAAALAAGDAVYLKRGDVWREQLVPPSSGASGNPIAFDAYGTGAAPVITAELDLSSNTWTYVSGSVWQSTLSSTIASPVINYVRFGTVYGQVKSGTCASVVANPREFCVTWPTLYVYAPAGTSPAAYYPSVAPVVGTGAGLNLIYVSSKKWLTFQHIKVQAFDYVGVGTAGSADNLVFANMESDGMVPNGTTPHGFYINASPAPTSIALYNDDAHLNYDGFHITGPAASSAGITLINCRAYGNRNVGLQDGTTKAVYSYSHFYGNGISQLSQTDVNGAIDGGNNILSDVAPVVVNWKRYPGNVTVTIDDVGLNGNAANTDTYIESIRSIFESRGLKFNAAVVTGYPSYVNWSLVNGWFAAGHGIDSHSWSHQYYTTQYQPGNAVPYPNAPALQIQYTGSGSAATMTLTGTSLTTTVTGAAGDGFTAMWAAGSTVNTVCNTVLSAATGKPYIISEPTVNQIGGPNQVYVKDAAHANFVTVSNQDIKTAFNILFDQTKLLPDEMSASKASIEANVTGLGSLRVYVYPDGLKDSGTDSYAIAAGYQMGRGSLSMRDTAGTRSGADAVAAKSINMQDITSLWLGPVNGYTTQQIQQRLAAFVFKSRVWGVPYGLFTHYNNGVPETSNTALGSSLDALTSAGATILTNSAMAEMIASDGMPLSPGNSKYVLAATGPVVDFHTIPGSVTQGAGSSLGSAYQLDLAGNMRAGAWDMGASQVLGTRVAGRVMVRGAKVE